MRMRLHAVFAEAIISPAFVGDGVRGLHRSDDAEIAEAREVRRRDDLRVLDAMTKTVRFHLFYPALLHLRWNISQHC